MANTNRQAGAAHLVDYLASGGYSRTIALGSLELRGNPFLKPHENTDSEYEDGLLIVQIFTGNPRMNAKGIEESE